MPGEKEIINIINPEITDVEIGIRNKRKIKIYPLSLKDQIGLSDLILAATNEYFEMSSKKEQDSELSFVSFLVSLLHANITRILSIVTDEDGENMLSELTIPQSEKIANIIYKVNYESVSKNLQSLIEKAKKVLPSVRP